MNSNSSSIAEAVENVVKWAKILDGLLQNPKAIALSNCNDLILSFLFFLLLDKYVGNPTVLKEMTAKFQMGFPLFADISKALTLHGVLKQAKFIQNVQRRLEKFNATPVQSFHSSHKIGKRAKFVFEEDEEDIEEDSDASDEEYLPLRGSSVGLF